DLFYRISGFTIELPPLRERKEDIPHLAHYFMTKENKVQFSKPISRQAMDKLMDYDWPGNVRELKNVIERGIILSEGKDEIPEEAVQLEISNAKNYYGVKEFEIFEKNLSLKEIEEKYINYLLSKGLTKSEIARIIGESERSVYRKLSAVKI
ncbi:MAG: hypothetical protein M0034_03540, partial [Deltaproteobacteria bacterium]|nr:hypothetical protein [Deltaproteobacteria bacterium]